MPPHGQHPTDAHRAAQLLPVGRGCQLQATHSSARFPRGGQAGGLGLTLLVSFPFRHQAKERNLSAWNSSPLPDLPLPSPSAHSFGKSPSPPGRPGGLFTLGQQPAPGTTGGHTTVNDFLGGSMMLHAHICPAWHGLQCREGRGLTGTTLPVPACNQGSAGRCPLRRGHRRATSEGSRTLALMPAWPENTDGRTPPLSDAGTRRPGDPPGTPRLRAAMGLHVANRKPRGTQPLCHHRGGTRAAYLLLGCVPTCLTDFSSV